MLQALSKFALASPMRKLNKLLLSTLVFLTLSAAFADSDGGHSDGDSGGSSGSSSGSNGGGGYSHPGATENDFLRFYDPLEFVIVSDKLKQPATSVLSADTEKLALQQISTTTALVHPKTPAPMNIGSVHAAAPDVPKNETTLALHDDGLVYRPLFTDTVDDVAVIVENANYKESSIPRDVAAINDAKFFKRFALEGLGIQSKNIIYLKDATKAQLLKVFGSERRHEGQLANWIRPGKSRVYVYYAGHGAPSEDSDAFLVPTDADSTYLELNGYSVSTLFGNLSKLNSKHTTVILESCFSGVSQAGAIINQASPLYLRPKKTIAPKNITVVSASQIHQIASWEKSEPRGLFTKYFLKAMSGEADLAPYGNADGHVSEVELEKYLGETLSYWARRYYGREQKAQIQNWSLK